MNNCRAAYLAVRGRLATPRESTFTESLNALERTADVSHDGDLNGVE